MSSIVTAGERLCIPLSPVGPSLPNVRRCVPGDIPVVTSPDTIVTRRRVAPCVQSWWINCVCVEKRYLHVSTYINVVTQSKSGFFAFFSCIKGGKKKRFRPYRLHNKRTSYNTSRYRKLSY